MKRILLSTFLVGSSLLFSDLYASNSFNDVDTANGSSTKSRRPNTFKSIVQKNEVVPLEEHEKLLSQLKESQKKRKSLEEEFAAFKSKAASNEEELLELEKLKALFMSASSKSKFLQTIASPFFLEFEKGIASAIKQARAESNMDFERMDEEINAMLIYALLRPEAFFPALMGPLLNSLGDQNEAMKIFATFTNGGYTLVDESPFSYNFQAHTKTISLNFGKGIDPEEMGGKVETKEEFAKNSSNEIADEIQDDPIILLSFASMGEFASSLSASNAKFAEVANVIDMLSLQKRLKSIKVSKKPRTQNTYLSEVEKAFTEFEESNDFSHLLSIYSQYASKLDSIDLKSFVKTS